jgi:hypothetical protein
MILKKNVSLQVKRGNLNKWNGLKVSLRVKRGNLIRKNVFPYMRLPRFTRNDTKLRLFHSVRNDIIKALLNH